MRLRFLLALIMIVPALVGIGAAPAQAAPRRTIALTFDDGPHPTYTVAVLAVLKKHRVKATFCMVGDQAVRYPRTARRVARAGHRICNHTRSHADMARLSSSAARRQVLTAQRQLRHVTGVTPTTFRFPYGSSNSRVRAVVRSCKLRNLGWDVDTRDWLRPSARTITARIVGNVRPGDVVLMHDGGGNRSTTVASLDATIRAMKRRGYTFVLA